MYREKERLQNIVRIMVNTTEVVVGDIYVVIKGGYSGRHRRRHLRCIVTVEKCGDEAGSVVVK